MIAVHLDYADFQRSMEATVPRFEAAALRAVKEATEGALRNARETRTYQDRTGTLRRNTVSRYSATTDAFIGRVEARTTYALWVEAGTKPHEIRVRNARFLVFFWPKVGHVVHFKKVNHPGTKPRFFMSNARSYGERSLLDDTEDYVERAFREAA